MEEMDNTPQGYNKNLTLLHEQLVKDNYAVPKDYAAFETTFKDSKNSKALFDQLASDKYAIPAEYDAFTETFGLKKKDLYKTLGFGRDLVQEVFGEDSPQKKEELPVSRKPQSIEELPDKPDDILSGAMLTPLDPKEKPSFESYLTALPQGFNKRMGEAIRNTGAILNMPQEAVSKAVKKVSDGKSDINEQFLKQAFSQVPILGAFSQENMDNLASVIENAGNPKEAPDNLVGKTLESTGSILFDIATIRATPTSKINALAKYGMERVPMFPTYLATMGGATVAREGGDIKDTGKAVAEGVASGLTYEGMGIAAGRVGQLVKEFGGTELLSSSSRALANSVMFGADSKLKGGTFAEGAAMGLVFGGYDIGAEAINKSIAHRSYISYLTTTDNAIKTVARMKINPEEMRKQSDELWTEYEKETDPIKKQMMLEEKTAIDNVINVNATTQEIIKNPKAFIDNIQKDPNLSPKEKNIWTNKIHTTIKDADPRLVEAEPIIADIKKKEGELEYWKGNEDADPMVKDSKVESITEQIKEGKQTLGKTLSKPLEDYVEKKEKPLKEEVSTENLSIGDKSFTDKAEMFKHLEDIAINKETGDIDKTWFDREIDAWPSIETVKAINEWTEAKKAEIKAKQEAETPIETGITKVQKEFDKNGLIDEIRSYNELSASQKKKNASQANNIRVNAKRLGFDIKDDADGMKLTQDGKIIKKTPVKVDKEKIEKQKLFTEHEPEFQKYVNDVMDTNPDLYGVMISGLSNAQRAQAYKDIKAGKKTTASAVALSEMERMYKEHGGIDVWNAEAQQKVSFSREEINAEKDVLRKRTKDPIEESYDEKQALENGLITKIEYDEITDYNKRADEQARIAEEDFMAGETGDREIGKEKSTEEVKPKPDEKKEAIEQPGVTIGKGEENKLQGSAETGIKPVKAEGKEKPIAPEPAKVEPIQKEPWQMTPNEYALSKGNGVDETAIAKAAHPQHVKDAIAEGKKVPMEVLEAYKNNEWAKKEIAKVEIPVKEASKSEMYQKADKLVETSTTGRKLSDMSDLISKAIDADQLKTLLDHPYIKRYKELTQQVYSKLQHMERHPDLYEEQKAPAKTEGIKFKDKTYQSVDEVLEAIDKGDITFDESKQLREDVGKFEEGLKDEAKKASDDIGNRLDKGINDSEKKIQDDINDENSKLSIKLFPDLISKANTVLYKQLVKVRDGLANTIAGQLKKGVISQNNAIRWTTKTLTNLYAGLIRTQGDMFGTGKEKEIGKLEMTGTVRAFAPHKALDLLGEWRKVVNGDPESLTRVWSVLDPELATKAGERPLVYGDLSQAEKNLYFTLKEWNTWVWSTNYANGLIPTESHLKFKGDFDATGYSDYIARMYDTHEVDPILSPEIQEFISRGNSAYTTRMITDYMKQREEITDWNQEHAVKDPAYLTAKRVMQTIQNVAVKQYMDAVIAQHPEYVVKVKKGEAVPKGFTKLGSSYSWGPFRNRAVVNHVVEDFTGFYYQNAITNSAYDFIKMFDRSKVNQFYKKYRTVYNPFVQTGNVTGNVFFASINGINPFAFTKAMVENRNLHKTDPVLYDRLLKSGLIGDVAMTGEMKPRDILNPKTGVLGKADVLATKAYVGADNLAKVSAYQIYRRQGLTHEQAVRRAYDSFQNYATVGKTWDFTSKIPLIGPTFVKFQADLQRILVNNMLTTPLTTIGTLMVIKMLGNLSSVLSGETEEEQKIREERKGVAKIPFANIPLSFKIGKSELNVARYLSPLYMYNRGDSEMDLGELSKFMPLQLQKREEGNIFPIPAFADAAWGWVGSVLADRDFRNMSIQDPQSTRYTNPNITTDERIFNVLSYSLRSQVPFWKGTTDIIKGATGQLDYYGRKRTWFQSIINNVVKIQQFDKPELKSYVERNLSYLTSKYASLAARMGDAQGNFFKAMKYAEDKGLDKEAMETLYESEIKKRDKRLQKSLDEQIPVLAEIDRLTTVYKKWHPEDEFLDENFRNIQSGKNQRFNVLNDVDLQKKHPEEYALLRNNNLLKKPEIPAYWQGTPVTEAERKNYANIYWSEYMRNLDLMGLTTQEEMDEAKEMITNITESTTRPSPDERTSLQEMAADAASIARDIANEEFRNK